MLHLFKTDEIEKHLENIPEELPILPLRNTVAYPFAVIPLAIGVPRSIKLVEEALQSDIPVGLVAMKDPSISEPQPEHVYGTGTIAKILRPVMTSSENSIQVLVQGLERFRVEKWLDTDSYLKAKVTLCPDVVVKDLELDAFKHSLLELAREVISLMPNLPDEVNEFLRRVNDPRYLIYLVASNSRLDIAEAQKILEMDDLKDKFRALISHLTKEKELLTLGKKIQSEAMEKMDKAHREYYLRQQLKAIQKELGETDEGESEAQEYEKRIEEARLPEEAEKEARRELKRLKGMSPQSAEYSVIKTYLDWILDLPWNVLSEDQLDINHARTVLNEDHYDLQDVKDRIIEYLAVRKLANDRGVKEATALKRASGETMGAILCFVGPPGVGKTSLGESIARALGRKFTRMSLGGIRDEAEIRGHRRTYIGAMPGRIIQAIKRVGTRNPVFMLDEIDKVGNDWRGDPSSALLEVLDPAQNHAFRDHYLDVDFNLSDVMFITTANQLETIPAPLRDRMEIIQLDGYTGHEKIK
ncbi:MAG: LON peptidase substrate-binding domain-containing protein, partial [Deltaproteobacteria bacterium]|nr:LON peptidase substrate-binding domain-containing protein [Deltaproteobacteria bacterium]